MKREDLPSFIISPLSGDKLELKNLTYHNDEELSVTQFTDNDSTEWYDDVVMYKNDVTTETIYISIER